MYMGAAMGLRLRARACVVLLLLVFAGAELARSLAEFEFDAAVGVDVLAAKSVLYP